MQYAFDYNMYEIYYFEDAVILEYKPHSEDADRTDWLIKILNGEKSKLFMGPTEEKDTYYMDDDGVYRYDVAKIFRVSKENIIDYDGESITFKIGSREGDYYIIPKGILHESYELKIHKDSKIPTKFFHDVMNEPAMKTIFEVVMDDICIGNKEGEISYETFKNAFDKCPTKAELKHYTASRIASVFQNDLNLKVDYEKRYENFVSKKINPRMLSQRTIFLMESERWIYLLNELKRMLDHQDEYTELQWKINIINMIPVLYPEYVAVFKETYIPTEYGRKFVDFTMLNCFGYLDAIEVKKPTMSIILNTVVRTNYIPSRDLSDTVIQLQNYLIYLSNWGKEGESILTKRYQKYLPKSIENIHVLNPCGMLILGRTKGLNSSQIRTLEVVRRQYKNIVQIITYDDILERMERTIDVLKTGKMYTDM